MRRYGSLINNNPSAANTSSGSSQPLFDLKQLEINRIYLPRTEPYWEERASKPQGAKKRKKQASGETNFARGQGNILTKEERKKGLIKVLKISGVGPPNFGRRQ